jgi:hypothetical protein
MNILEKFLISFMSFIYNKLVAEKPMRDSSPLFHLINDFQWRHAVTWRTPAYTVLPLLLFLEPCPRSHNYKNNAV